MPTYEAYSITVSDERARSSISRLKQDLGISDKQVDEHVNESKRKINETEEESKRSSKRIEAATKITISMVWSSISQSARGLIKLLGLNKTVAGRIAGVVIQTITSMISTAYRAAAIAAIENNWVAVLAAGALAIQLPVDIMNITTAINAINTDTTVEDKLQSIGGF